MIGNAHHWKGSRTPNTHIIVPGVAQPTAIINVGKASSLSYKPMRHARSLRTHTR